jgi:hypothetical protein
MAPTTAHQLACNPLFAELKNVGSPPPFPGPYPQEYQEYIQDQEYNKDESTAQSLQVIENYTESTFFCAESCKLRVPAMRYMTEIRIH